MKIKVSVWKQKSSIVKLPLNWLLKPNGLSQFVDIN